MPRLRSLCLAVAALVATAASTSYPSAHQPRHRPTPMRSMLPTATRFGWPLPAPHPVVRPFQPPETPYGPGHRGADLGGDVDMPVLAAGDGEVVFAGNVVDRGVVSVQHAGIRTTYEPVAPTVAAGTAVRRGDVIGHLTASHPECRAAQACLHWGARRGDDYLDPLRLLSVGHVRLLPCAAAGDRPVSPPNGPRVSRAAGAPPWCAADTPGIR